MAIAVIVLVIEAQLYDVSSSTGCWVSLRALPKNHCVAGSCMWTMAIPPPTTPCCDRTASKRWAKAVPWADAGAGAAIRQLARSAAQEMGNLFDMTVMIIRLHGRDGRSGCGFANQHRGHP